MLVQAAQVRFRVDSIYLPQPAAVMQELFGQRELEGRILDFSDNGRLADRFAIVAVPGLSKPVMVPVEALSTA